MIISQRANPVMARVVKLIRPSSFRQFSTISPPSAKENSEHEGASQPKLNEVPSLPFVGSTVPWYSGIPKLEMSTQYDLGLKVREKFGDFYSIGIPGLGVGIHGTAYGTIDPNEMMKVVRNEGAYPSGIFEKQWAFRRAWKESNSAMVGDDYGFLGRGFRWKKQRTFLQTGMLDPQAARGFIPGIISAAEMASKSAPHHQHNLNDFLNYSSFDMLCSFMLGSLTDTAASYGLDSANRNEENELFVRSAVGTIEGATRLGNTPSEYIMSETLGLKSKAYRKFEDDFNLVQDIGRRKIDSFFERYENGDLDDLEKSCYLAGAIERMEAEGPGGVTKEEMIDLCLVTLCVGVDTTSSVTAWNLVHLAMNPEVQARLYQEISDVVSMTGKLDAKTLTKSSSPYLHAVLRESHRITPAFSVAMWKENSQSEIDVHGVTIPKGSLVFLNHISYDPQFVEDPWQFKPERWSAQAVRSRSGTHSEILDHPTLRDPFSQGARRCPGSRVATNEVLAMISQLVLDWRISCPIKSLKDIKYDNFPIKPIIPKLEFTARV